MSKRSESRKHSKSQYVQRIKYLEAIIYHVEKAIIDAGLTVTKGPNGFIVEPKVVEEKVEA